MLRRSLFFLIVIGLAHICSGETSNIKTWGAALNESRLFAPETSALSPVDLEHFKKQIGRPLTEKEAQLLKRDASGSWRTYEDAQIRFDIPDDPLLEVEALAQEQKPKLKVVGSVVSSVDNRYEQVYKITFSDGLPYGLILITEADWFDEGICFCGAIGLKTFIVAEGNLLELSLLESGKIKKAQVINDRRRAILFEWTHSAITQSAYARIATSIRLKEPSKKDSDDWLREAQARRGQLAAGTGWLRPEMAMREITSLLGEPTREGPDQLIYEREIRNENGSGDLHRLTLPLSEGKLAPLTPRWQQWEELAPNYGSLAWMRATLRDWSDQADELPEGTYPTLPKADVDTILQAFLEHAPEATGHTWGDWCYGISQLARFGVFDSQAIELIAKRAFVDDLNHHETRWALELYEHPKLTEFTHHRIRLFHEVSGEWLRDYLRSELHNLYAGLRSGGEVDLQLIRDGIDHPDSVVREDAIYWVGRFPEVESLRLLKKGLTDPAAQVRRVAIYSIDDLCTAEDREWLNALLATEEDERNREDLVDKIAEL